MAEAMAGQASTPTSITALPPSVRRALDEAEAAAVLAWVASVYACEAAPGDRATLDVKLRASADPAFHTALTKGRTTEWCTWFARQIAGIPDTTR